MRYLPGTDDVAPEPRLPASFLALRPGAYHRWAIGLIAIETVRDASAQLPAPDTVVIVAQVFLQRFEGVLFEQLGQGVEDRPAEGTGGTGILRGDIVEQACGQRPQ